MRSSTARWPTTRPRNGSAPRSEPVTQVVTVPRPSRLIQGSDETLLAFTAELEATPATASCWRPVSSIALISELTLMVRPLATLLDVCSTG